MGVNLGEIGAKAGDIGGTVLMWGGIILGGLAVIAIVGGIIWALRRRKRWNLVVEIKLPRTNGETLLRERAKGHWDVAAGIIDIKRKRLKAVGMKPFDVKKYLQGTDYLEVIQVGPTDYLPVLPKSYQTLQVKEIIDGKEEDVDYALMSIETNLEKRRTWKNYMERSAKNRFTIFGFLDKHWRAIEISIILFVVFLGMAILWARMPSICG